MFECKRCGYGGSQRRSLKIHLSKNIPCIARDASSDVPREDLINELNGIKSEKQHLCSFCNKTYVTRYTLVRHYKSCKVKNATVILTSDEYMKLIQVQAPRQVVGIINNLDNSKHLHITFNNLVEFKDANYKAVQAFFKKVPLNEMIDYVHMDVDNIHPKMMKNLFFNEKRKENITLAVTDVEKNEASIFEDGRWQKGDAREIVNDILLVNATEVKNANYNLPKDLRRDSNELNSLFNGSVTGKMVRFAHENLPIVEAIHGKIFS